MENITDTRLLHISGSGNYTNILKELGDYSIKEDLAFEGLTDALIKREDEYPTGLDVNGGVAIAHADIVYTKKPTIIVANLDKPAVFRSMVEKKEIKVQTVFLLLVKEAKNQVKVLENIVSIIQDERKMKKIKSDEGNDFVKELFALS